MVSPLSRRQFCVRRVLPFLGAIAAGPALALAPRTANRVAAEAPPAQGGRKFLSDVQRINAERAVDAYRSMQERFRIPGTARYRERYPWDGEHPHAYHWPFVQALVATLCLYGTPRIGADFSPDIDRHLAGLAEYWDAEATPPGYASVRLADGGGDKYYDDNLWAGLAMIQLYRLRGDLEALIGGPSIPGAARQVYDFLLTGWDEQDAERPGGVYWVEQGRGAGLSIHHRGTDTNAPGAKLGRHLFELMPRDPERESFRIWSDRIHEWLDRWLYDEQHSRLYWDKILNDGSIDIGFWTYNQGTPIGAATLAFRITRDAHYLRRAERIAEATLKHCWQHDNFFRQPAAFNAIFFRNLLLLYAENGQQEYLESMQAYADRMWTEFRDPNTGLIRSDLSEYRLHDQAAMVQIFACLAWDPEQYTKLA